MRFLCGAVLLVLCCMTAAAQVPLDSDHDGLDDTLEQALLERFVPIFMVSKEDCSVAPARFREDIALPTVAADDGTIYGQAFRTGAGIELHFYHLWRADCGRMGHPLDTEHVSTLLTGTGDDDATYTARYWYAAAHEDTVCDASQITRAATINAQTHGAKVWISTGKHASFLDEELCKRGCGGDRCEEMTELHNVHVINLGEADAPMNGAVWAQSAAWPGLLSTKMTRSDMRAPLLTRLETLPDTDVAWANPEKRPAQATIAAGSTTIDALAMSDRKTNTALVIATDHTSNALDKSYGAVKGAIGTSLKNTGRFLRGGKRESEENRPKSTR
ncbi:MAG: hypothetical protein JSS87_14885 [Acidobacteria bacterium]|nr:hypothetical protein [Acidobacteriota bacterium]